MTRRTPVVLATVSALLLGGCSAGGKAGGGGGDAPPAAARASTSDRRPSTAALNRNDVMFLQMMVPHHRQGVELAGLGRTRGTRAELTTLAAAIESTQRDEAEAMSGWLRESGEPAAAAPEPNGDDPHAAHGGMPGTSATEMAALRAAAGVEFERRFLNTMMAHQGDAVRLARMELASGADPRLADLAERMERSRTAQIEQMQRLLDSG